MTQYKKRKTRIEKHRANEWKRVRMRRQIESQQRVKSKSEQKDFSLADRQRAELSLFH